MTINKFFIYRPIESKRNFLNQWKQKQKQSETFATAWFNTHKKVLKRETDLKKFFKKTIELEDKVLGVNYQIVHENDMIEFLMKISLRLDPMALKF